MTGRRDRLVRRRSLDKRACSHGFLGTRGIRGLWRSVATSNVWNRLIIAPMVGVVARPRLGEFELAVLNDWYYLWNRLKPSSANWQEWCNGASERGWSQIASKKTDPSRMGARTQAPEMPLQLRPVGVIRSTLKTRREAPRQGSEGAPDAWLEVNSFAAQALEGLSIGDNVIVVTWLHRAKRDVLKVHPRSDPRRPLTGVFSTRSPDRPNPLGLHRVTVRRIAKNRLRIGPIEAIDGTPVIDIKAVLSGLQDS